MKTEGESKSRAESERNREIERVQTTGCSTAGEASE